jgi:glycine/D-amino acid oxidase-like deaminating enzyme
MPARYDVAVIGAGVFGAWTAHHLRRQKARAVQHDANGPANTRASSGGETRVIRMSYGPDELYTRMSMASLVQWRELSAASTGDLFQPTGVVWLSRADDPYTRGQLPVFARCGVRYETLDADAIRRRWPQLRVPDVTLGVFEPESGALMARRSVQALVDALVKQGVDYVPAAVVAPTGRGPLESVRTASGHTITAETFVFACGPWLPKLFPEAVGDRIFATRQEVFFLGAPPGSDDFRPPRMPAWIHHTHPDRPYSIPDIEGRGFKLAFDTHGGPQDPDEVTRLVPASSLERLRVYLRDHIPALAEAPVLETRVCQYENTWNGDFLIDRHPDLDNVWLVGGGSGHGFKHGPAVGEHTAARVLQGVPAEPRFTLASKQSRRARAVY